MSRGFRNSIFGGSGSLVIPQIQSPNYVAGSAGWQIRKDGTVEFNQGTFRGTIVDSSSGAALLIYDGPPGNGNLILAISSGVGTDQFGNNFGLGLSFQYNNSSNFINWLINRPQPPGPVFGTPSIASIVSGTTETLELVGPSTNSFPPHSAGLSLGADSSSLQGTAQLSADNIILGAHGTAFGQLLAGTFAASFSASNSATGTLTFPTAFAAAPVLTDGVMVGSNLDILVNWQGISAGSATWRAFQKDGLNVTGTAHIQWVGIG